MKYRRYFFHYLIIIIMMLPLTIDVSLTVSRLFGDNSDRARIEPLSVCAGKDFLSVFCVRPLDGLVADTNGESGKRGWFRKDKHLMIERNIVNRMVLRPLLVRVFNQFYYYLFNKSYMYSKNIIIGNGKNLFEKAYIDKYCNLGRAKYDSPFLSKWLQDLIKIDKHYKENGKSFVYFISPSKASYYSEDIPSSFGCNKSSTRPDYYAVIDYLKDSGVTFVDGSKLMIDMKRAHPVGMFPRGGTHWNMLAATLASNSIISSLRSRGDPNLPDIDFTYTVDQKPEGSDSDLMVLLNLLVPDLKYDVPHVKYNVGSTESGRRLSLAIIGGSFMNSLYEVFMKYPTISQIDYFNYFKIGHHSYPVQGNFSVDLNDRASYNAINTADIVILEENEEHLNSGHMRLLMEKLEID